MSQEQAIQFLQQGIAAAKAKQNDDARQHLQNAIRLNPDSETAWLWLASVARDNKERVFCLRQLLQINPENEFAIKGLQAMGVSAEQAESAKTATSSIPRPAPEKIAEAQAAFDNMLAEISIVEDPYESLEWVHKRRNRAGERAATAFNIAVRVIPVLIILGILGGGAYFVSQNPDAIAFAPTWTPSYTPTVTPTPTPGFTPTPSPTPELTYTPTMVIEQINAAIPEGDLHEEMTITPVYPSIRGNRLLQEAIMLMDDDEYSAALPTLAAERENLIENSPDQNPFYYEAHALIAIEDYEAAERVLAEGFTRMEDLDADTSLLQAGMAELYAAQGEINDASEAAELALEGDPELAQPYHILVSSALENENYQDAADYLDTGLDANPDDVGLWILQGNLNLARGQAPEAQQDARVALHIDPTAEDAYLLQARADMAFGDNGLAVLHLQDYLFLYPGSIEGWTLLGDARTLEGNTDLAIIAYSRAVNSDDIFTSQIPAFLSRAAIYNQRNQYQLAYEDYDTVLDIDAMHLGAREGRAIAAYNAGRYAAAIDDIDTILEETPDRPDLQLLQAKAIIDGANPRNEDAYTTALEDARAVLNNPFIAQLDEAAQPEAYEYRARVFFAQGFFGDALLDIDEALVNEESGSRHYWRGRILEEMNIPNDAVSEYAWVTQWGSIYSYPFLPDAIDRLEALTIEG